MREESFAGRPEGDFMIHQSLMWDEDEEQKINQNSNVNAFKPISNNKENYSRSYLDGCCLFLAIGPFLVIVVLWLLDII